jgi:hypothetical protein
LRFARDARHKASQLFRRLSTVWNSHDISHWFAALGQQQKSFASDVAKGGPTHYENLKPRTIANQRWPLRGGNQLRPLERNSHVTNAKNVSQPLLRGLKGLAVRFRGRKVTSPMSSALVDRRGDLTQQESIDTID